MPCDTVSTARVKLNAATINKDLLRTAMKELGIEEYEYSIDSSGTMRVNGRNSSKEFTAEVNRAYSKQILFSQAKRFGWTVKPQADGSYVVQKATF